MKKTCNLCKKKVKNLARSHLIPYSFHREINFSKLKSYSQEPGSHPKKSPTGSYDRIVCHDCKKLFGPWDQYAIELYKFIPPVTAVIDSIKAPKGKKRIDSAEVEIIDYRKLKLFVLSMLWRSHASKRKDFRIVKLGDYEKKIRAMIINNNPGTAEDFPFYINKYKMPPRLRVITSPVKLKISRVITTYRFNLLDLEIYIKVSSQPFPMSLSSRIVRPDNPLRMILIDLDGSPLEAEMEKAGENENNLELRKWYE